MHVFIRTGYHNQPPIPMSAKRFYECGCCGAMHSDEWWGDCREDDARFDVDDLDRMFGPNGWTEVGMLDFADDRPE